MGLLLGCVVCTVICLVVVGSGGKTGLRMYHHFVFKMFPDMLKSPAVALTICGIECSLSVATRDFKAGIDGIGDLFDRKRR